MGGRGGKCRNPLPKEDLLQLEQIWMSAPKCWTVDGNSSDMIITGDDAVGIYQLKKQLHDQFEIKDFGALRYFLGIEVAPCRKALLTSS